MPWQEVSIMDRRREFVDFAQSEGANISLLCRQFGISRKTGYKWVSRAELLKPVTIDGLADRSRRPLHSPARTDAALEQAVLNVRDSHPAWGARKIASCLQMKGVDPPAASTVHAILVRHGRIVTELGARKAFGSFEKDAPNLLWQMDFKGQFQLGDGSWCYPLTIVDDHSRFSLCLSACTNQQTQTVKGFLEQTFHSYGLPAAFYVDNGPPWGGTAQGKWTPLTVWLLKLGIGVIYATPYCPQGRGKNERFHRTLKAEVLSARPLTDMAHAQKAFDSWRLVYNHDRPHEALDMKVPASRYTPSIRPMPTGIPTIEYDSTELVRRVAKALPFISFKNRPWRVPKAFAGEVVAVRPTGEGLYDIYFGATRIAKIDLKAA